MAASDRIVVATSIPPRMPRFSAGEDIGDRYQKLCVQSWVDCGFRVLSLNDSDEVPALAREYPQITFVPTKANASAISGRKSPYIADVLNALLATPGERFGIINADLVFETSSAWQTKLPLCLDRSLVVVQRHDTTSLLDGAFRMYFWGFDCFFFDRRLAQAVVGDAGSFAMGLPWWDYWLPAAAAFRGLGFQILGRPAVAHLVHPQGYKNATLRRFALMFARSVLADADRQDASTKSELSSLLGMCQGVIDVCEFSAAQDDEDRTISNAFADQISPWLNDLLRNSVRLTLEDAAPPPGAETLAQEGALTPATIFHRLEDRLWAGAAAERAKVMESDGKMEDVGGWLQAALERTPNDFEILSRFGEFLCRRGDHAHALALLNKAREQQPKSVGLLNNIGVALRGLSRREEAISCFEQALNGDPGFRDAYYNLAVTLFETKRAHDAVARLDAALARWPGDLGLQEIHRHFSRGLTQPNATPPNRR